LIFFDNYNTITNFSILGLLLFIIVIICGFIFASKDEKYEIVIKPTYRRMCYSLESPLKYKEKGEKKTITIYNTSGYIIKT